MDYTYPVPWHMTPKGVQLCSPKKRLKCKHASYQDHVEAVSEDHAVAEFKRQADLRSHQSSKAFYLGVKPASGGPNFSEQYITGPRDFSNKIAEYEREHGATLDRIVIQGEVQLFDNVPPIKITRRYVELSNGGYAARWDMERVGSSGHIVTRRIYPYSVMERGKGTDNVASFINHDYEYSPDLRPWQEELGMDFKVRPPKGLENPAFAEVRKHETLEFLYELLATVEATAALSTHPLRNRLIATARAYCLLHKDEQGMVGGTIEYGTSGWRPELLRNADVGENELHSLARRLDTSVEYAKTGKRKVDESSRLRRFEILSNMKTDAQKEYDERSIKGLSANFAVHESHAGAGAAQWRMDREGPGWRLTVRGSHGQKYSVTVATPDEAESEARLLLNRTMKHKNLANAARQVGAKLADVNHVCGVEPTREEAIENRVQFIRSLVQETAAFEAKARQVQAELSDAWAAIETFTETGIVTAAVRDLLKKHP